MHEKKVLSRFLLEGFTDLEDVLAVKLEAVLCPCNASIIYDLTGLAVAFRDLEKPVCGRNEFEVTCMATCKGQLIYA